MADRNTASDKKIIDFITLADAKDDDLILVASEGETYTMRVKTLKDAVQGNAERAEAAARAAQEMAEQVKVNADKAISESNTATQKANNAAAGAETSAQLANKAAHDTNSLSTQIQEQVNTFLTDKEAEFLERLGRKIVVTDTDPGFGSPGKEGSVIFVYREPYRAESLAQKEV